MASATVNTVLSHIHRIAGAAARQARTDRQLLEEFARTHEESAFAVLVRRHGSMVLNVCRRVLAHQQDAEDVFQATFLVLARKAGSVRWHDSVGNWLYGVAYRLARKQRCSNARRQKHLVSAAAEPRADAPGPSQWQDVQSVLDEELGRLPDKYRAPLVLCYLEGKTRDEAAQQLGWTLPVIKGRLERGRNLLRQRLTRRGLTLSAALMPLALAESASAVSLAAPLVSGTVMAATSAVAGQALSAALSPQVVALTQGALRAMFLTKIKFTTLVVLCVALLGTGAGVLTHQVLGGNAFAATAPVDERPAPDLIPVDPAFIAFSPEGQREGEKGKTLAGLLKEIDTKKGTIVVTTQRDGEGKVDHTLSLAGKNIKIIDVAERAVKLDDLETGMRVKVALSANDDVTSVQVLAKVGKGGGEKERGKFASGTIKAVDAKKGTITLTIKGEGREIDKTYEVAQQAKFATADKDRADLGEIKAGERALLRLEEQVVVSGKIGVFKDAGGDKERPNVVTGELVSVARDKQAITIVQRKDAGDSKKTLTVNKDLKISFGEDRPGTLDDLKPGMKLLMMLSDDQQRVISIIAIKGNNAGKGVPAFLKKVNANDRTITVAVKGDGGAEKERTLTLAKEVRLIIPGKENATVNDLPESQRVLLQFGGDRQTVVGIRVLKGERDEE